MAPIAIPSEPLELTPQWLTSALREEHVLRDEVVRAASVMPLGASILGRVFQVTLDYGGGQRTRVPRTVVAKLPSAAPSSVELCASYGFYKREVNFYRYVPPWAELPVPKFYYGQADGDGRRFVLLIEDLSEQHVPGNQLGGSDREQFADAVDLAARMHAQCLGRLGDVHQDWLVDSLKNAEPTCAYYAGSLPRVYESFGDQFSSSDRRVADGLYEYIPRFWKEMTAPPVTLIHGDFRLENVLFARDRAARTPRVVDFQFCGTARPAYDLGYLMSQSAQTDLRRSAERPLLERYHRAFLAAGGTGYDFDACLLDYRKAILYCLVYPIVACGALDVSSAGVRAFGTSYLQRSLSAIADWSCADLL